MKLTPELLTIAVGCTYERARLFAGYLDAACAHFQIDSLPRMAAFLAQVGHESGSFRYVRELADGSAYEGRANLGNTQQGDGRRYRGRGLIQITGRDNYRQTTQRMRELGTPNFVEQPEALEEIRWAAWSAADWWASRQLNGLADVGAFDQITMRINGGQNGAADRRARWERAKQALATDAAPAPETPAVADPGQPASHPTEWDLNNPPPPPPEKPMPVPIAPIIAALLPSIIEAIPKLGRVFGSGSEVAERNIKAAELVVETVKTATGAINAQDAVERLRTDPGAALVASKAVDGIWYELTEAGGGGIDGARKASMAYLQPGLAGFWLNPSFWISMILIAMPMMLLVDVLFVHPESYVGELRTQIVTGVLMVIGMVGGYWIGTSISSARKDERAA